MRLDEYCRAVGRDCRLTTTDRVVMWTMATYVNRVTGETFVSLPTIATDACLHIDTVRRAVHRLEEHGVIAGRPRVGRSTIYRFPLHPALTTTPRASAGGRVSTTPRDDAGGGSPQPLAGVPHTPRASVGNPSRQRGGNRIGNHVDEPRGDATNGDRPNGVAAKSVEDYLRPFAQIAGRT